MDKEEISYKILREIQQKEKNSPLLTKIDKNFYSKVSEYVKNLHLIVEKEKDERKIKLYNDEIKNTKKIVLNIYEIREKKITQIALSKIRGAKPDLINLLEIERNLFDSLVKNIQNYRIMIFKNDVKLKQDKNEKKEPISSKQQIVETNTNPIVRVMQSTPEFIGTDMNTYKLRKDDVLTLTNDMSKPLITKNVVKKIK